jgi:hypothetical protein
MKGRRAGLLIALACAGSFLVLFGLGKTENHPAAPGRRAVKAGRANVSGPARAAPIPELRSPLARLAAAPVFPPGPAAPAMPPGEPPRRGAAPKSGPEVERRAPVSSLARPAPVSAPTAPAPVSRPAPSPHPTPSAASMAPPPRPRPTRSTPRALAGVSLRAPRTARIVAPCGGQRCPFGAQSATGRSRGAVSFRRFEPRPRAGIRAGTERAPRFAGGRGDRRVAGSDTPPR